MPLLPETLLAKTLLPVIQARKMPSPALPMISLAEIVRKPPDPVKLESLAYSPVPVSSPNPPAAVPVIRLKETRSV